MFKVSLSTRFLILACTFVCGFIIVAMIQNLFLNINISQRFYFLLVCSFQAVIMFSEPSIITAQIEGKSEWKKKLGLNDAPSMKSIAGVIIVFIVGMTLMNQIIYWNDNLILPDWANGFAKASRELEESARKTSEVILNINSVSGLIINLLVVSVLTGIAEELFFRGGLQRLLCYKLSGHSAVWISAIIFSAMHVQLYGFFPRMLLGAFFGYVYLWTGNLWISIFAHAFNNAIVIISECLVYNSLIDFNSDSIGVIQSGFPVYAAVSGVLLIIVLYHRKLWFLKKG